MAKGFNLTAEINLRGPSNIRQVVSSIRKQLTGINADVNVKISPQTAKTINIANKSFQNFNKTLKQTQSVAAATASSLGQLSNASSQLAGGLKGIPTTVNQAAQATQTLSQTNVKAIGTVRQLGSEFSEFGKQSALAVRRFAAFATVTGIIYQVSNAINQASKDFLAFEQELIKVAQVSGSSVANLDFLVQNVTRLSTTLGVASEDLIGVSRTLTQAGLSARETSTALEALAKSALAPTFDDLNRTVEGSVALMKQFGISAGQLEGALGSINAVAGQFAVEAGDIITAISRTGGVFASASQGVSQGTDALNEFIAVFTSVRATTRESAETIATGLRTIFTRIQRTDTVDALEAYGVSLKDLEGKFVGPYKAVQLLAEGLGRLDPRDFKFSQIVEELGGFRQIGKVIPLIQQFATAQDALRVAQEGQGSLARDAATAQQSLAVQIARVREEFTGLIRSVGQSEGFRTFISLGLNLASAFLQVADAAKAALPAITALFAVKGFKALTQFGSGFLGGLKKNTGFNEGGYVPGFARGGMVPGSGNSDTVRARLTPGEFVIRKKAVQAIGQDRLHKMNNYASGGVVNLPSSKPYVKNLPSTYEKDRNQSIAEAVLAEKRLVLNKEDTINASIVRKPIDPLSLRGVESQTRIAYQDILENPSPSRKQSQDRGLLFENMLEQSGMLKKAEGTTSRIDAIAKNSLIEIKSTAEQVSTESLLDKVAGAIFRPRSNVDQIASDRASQQAMSKNPDNLSIGKLQVFEDVARLKQVGKKFQRQSQIAEQEQNKNLGGYIQTFASGGSAQDTVPALLTPGEFVINKKAASRIGSQRLHKLNKADKIQGYNQGGAVGRVQRFANGGTPARPGTTLDSIGINPADIDILRSLAKTIEDLGLSSSSSQKILEQGKQVSYEAALQAAESDKQRAIAIGASTTEIDESIAKLQSFGNQMELVSGALEGVRGENLQGLQRKLAQGQTLEKAAKSEKLPELEALAKSGLQIDTSSVQNYIAQAARDRKTLQQMDTRYIADRSKALKAEGKSNQDALKIAQQEVALRRKTISDFATTQGAKGPADFGKRIAQASTQLGIGVSIFTGTLAGILGEAQTAIQAGMNAALASGGATFGASQVASGAIVELLPTDRLKAFGGAIGLGVSALAALGSAAIAAANAAREFRINEQFKKAETASEQVAEAFAKLEKDANSINIQSAIEDKLVQAGEALSRGLAIQNNTAKVFWANAIDVISSGAGQTGEQRSRSIQESAQRSEILEKDGFFDYLRSIGDDQFRESRTRARLPEKAQASAQQFKPVADNINKLIEQRLGKGESVADILADADFDSFANSLAMADQATNQRIQAIMADTSLSNEVRDSRIKNIRSIYAETQVRRQAAQQARQKEIDALETSTARYTNSLERMYTNMEQSINAVAASLNRMNSQMDTTIASLQGQAKIGDVILDAINVLQNPRAYRSPEVQAATTSAASMFGSEASNMAGLINLGENIEASVFSSINRTLEKAASQGGRASNAQIETDIETGVQNTLQGLGLPPELADKLANEVRAALKDITKDTEGDFDFAEISEKIAGLGSVIQSSARAREVAIKALEAYNAALNSYTQNVNKIIDIEISSRTYARKSLDILSNSALDLSKALGRSVSVSDVLNKRNKEIARQTGGPVSATDIFDQIQKLERDRVSQQAGVDTTAAMGIAGANQFVEFNNRLKDTSIGLRENIAALKSMAENTEVASTALNKIQEAQQRNASQVGFLEKIVSSTPEELESTNRAFARLQNNMNGQINTINNSVGAQKAYYEALQSGASQFEAMRAAQGAFARERGETLGVLQDILPFLGDSEQAGGIRANVLESMLKESGVGVSPVFQQILNTLRNPQADPAVAAAIQQYKQANAAQAQANKLLGNLEGKLAQDIATQNEQSFKNALQQTIINFENAKLTDIADGIQQIVQNTAVNNQPNNPPNNPAPGVTLSTGGVVYAQTGTEIFKPKGTDTVPAMLTPGEFVVNRTSTQANLPLLKQINSGYYAAGGEVGTSWHRDVNPIPFTRRNQITKEKYLDLDSFDARNSEQYVALPSVLHIVPEDTRYYPPNLGDALSYQALQKTGKVNFGFVPGIATVAERRTYTGGGGGYGYSDPVEYTAYLVKYQDTNSDKYKSIDDQESFSVLSTSKTRQLSAEELDDYKNKLRPLRNQSFVDPDYLTDVSSKSLSSIPTTASATATATSYDPNIQSNKEYLGLATPETLMSLKDSIRNVDTSMPAYKQWKVSGDGPLKKDVLSIGQPSFVNAGDTRNSPQLATNATYASRTFDPSIIQTSSSIKDLSDKHKIAYEAYVQSKNLLVNKPAMEGGEISPIYEKLTNLFNGITPFETFSDGKIFNDYSKIATNAKSSSLTVVADRDLASLVEKRGEMAKTAHAKGVDIKGHYGHSSLPNSPVTSSRPFDVRTPKKRKDFSWFAGVSQAELGKEFDELQAKALEKNASDDGINKIGGLITQTLKFPVKIGGKEKGFATTAQYREYRGQLYDANTGEYDGNQFVKFLPWKVEDKNSLFANITQDLDWLAFNRMLQQNQAPFAMTMNAGIQKKITDYYNSITDQNKNGDQGIAAALAKAKVIMKPSLLKLPKSSSNLPVFLDKLNTGQNVRIGDVFVENIKRLAAEAAAPVKKIAEPVGFTQQGEQLEDDQFADVTKKLVKGGLQIFGRRNFRGVSQFLARNLGRIPNNARLDTQEEAKQAAGFASNIFGRVGNEASNVMTQTRNARLFQAFKDAWVLASGGSAAFNNIAAGSTETINDFFRYAGNDLPPAAVEGLFRALGAPITSEQFLSKTVSKQGIKKLEQELQNGKIATALEDGTIEYSPMLDTIQKGLDLRGLSQILFNPYNAFPRRSTRTNLLDIFQSGLQKATLPNSRIPFFDPNTYNWIASGMNTLKQWYGGTQNWFGQDYIFDKNANPNDNDRAQALATQFAGAGIKDLYRQAQAVNAAFGVKARFGNLPNDQWFLARARAGADPQTLATGGIVYASTGGQMVNYQPRGTDTVPAMLTPGEFVINRKATQENLPLLKAINGGTKAYSRGGVVNYLQDGGIATETTKYSQGVPITRENKTVKNIQRLLTSDELYNQKYNKDTQQARALLSSIQKDTQQGRALLSSIQGDTRYARVSLSGYGYASGGVVYAQNGQYVNYQPKGTDTVPAMLTPGEFVINRKATQQNLPLLTAINSGAKAYSLGGVVYAAYGGEANRRLDVQDKDVLDAQQKSLYNNLAQYSTDKEKLREDFARGLGIVSYTVNPDAFGDPSARTADYRAAGRGAAAAGGRVRFKEQLTGAATIRHEMAHAIGHTGTAGKIAPFITDGLIKEVRGMDLFAKADSSYTVMDLVNMPGEMFAVLASVNEGIGSEAKKFLQGSLRALGYNKGGVVYAQNGVRASKEDEFYARLQAAQQTRTGLTTYDTRTGRVTLTDPLAGTVMEDSGSPYNNNDFSWELYKENFIDGAREIAAQGEATAYGLIKSATPAAAGIAATTASAPVLGPGAPVVGIPAGLAAASVQERILNAIAPELNAYMNKVMGERLIASTVGGAVGGGGLRSIVSGARNFRQIAQIILGTPAERAVAGTVGGGISLGFSALDGELTPEDLARAGIEAMVSAAIPEGRRPGQARRPTTRQQSPLGIEGLPGRGGRLSRPETLDSTSSLTTTTDTAPAIVKEIPSIGGDKIQSVNQYQSLQQYQNALKQKFEAEKTKISEYFSSPKSVSSETIRIQQGIESGSIKLKPNETIDGLVQNRLVYRQKNQTDFLEGEYLAALKTAEYDFNAGRTKPLDDRYSPFRNQKSKYSLRIAPSDNPAMNSIQMLDQYSQDVYDDMMRRLVALTGPQLELPQTLSRGNFLFNENGIEITGIGTQPPGVQQVPFGQFGVTNTLRRVPMADLLTEVLTSDFRNIRGQLSEVRGMGPLDESSMSEVLSRPDTFGVPQQAYGTGGRPRVVKGTGMAYTVEVDKLATDILSRNSNKTMSSADTDPALRTSKGGINIEDARDLITRTEKSVQARIRAAIEKSSQFTQQEQVGQPASNDIRIISPMDADKATNIGSMIGDIRETVAYYDDPVTGQPNQAWGRVSAIPYDGPNGVTPSGKRIFKIETALAKQGYGRALYDALVEYITSKNGVVMQDTQQTASGAKVWSNEAGTGIYQQPDRYQREGPGVVTTPDSTGSRYQVGNQDARMPVPPARSYGTDDPSGGGLTNVPKINNSRAQAFAGQRDIADGPQVPRFSEATPARAPTQVSELQKLQEQGGPIPNLVGNRERPLFSRELGENVIPEQIADKLAQDRAELETVARLMSEKLGRPVTAVEANQRLTTRAAELLKKSKTSQTSFNDIFNQVEAEGFGSNIKKGFLESSSDYKTRQGLEINREANRRYREAFKNDTGELKGEQGLRTVFDRVNNPADVIIGRSQNVMDVNPEQDVRLNFPVIELMKRGIYQNPSNVVGGLTDPQQKIYPTSPLEFYKRFYYSTGGVAYANNGMLVPYEPRGTDTVPAMLTPGEFVVNRAATQANLPLLKAINNGAQGYSNGGIAYRSRGGPIQYLADGSTNGPVQVVTTEFANSLDSATRALTNFGAVIERLKTAFNQNNGSSNSQNQQNNSGGVNIDMKGISLFTTKLQSLITQLQNLSQIPSEIKLVGTHRVDVNILGAEAFQNLDPAISSLITSEVEKALNLYNQKTFFV